MSTTSELGRARCAMMELFTTDRHQLQPAAAMVLVIDPAFSCHMCSTWKVSSKLATSS
jgi:hypothetical protein